MHFRDDRVTERDRKLLATLDPETERKALYVFGEALVVLSDTPYYLSLPGLTPCRRTARQQHALYRKGRTMRPDESWVQTGAIVTKCDGYDRLSRHQSGRALDVVLRARDTGKVIWHDSKAPDEARECFELVVREFEAQGFEWGGHWRPFQDVHHFQLPPDRRL